MIAVITVLSGGCAGIVRLNAEAPLGPESIGETQKVLFINLLQDSHHLWLPITRFGQQDNFSEEIRQMVVGRYRVLFTIRGRKVHVLHVRGAYVGAID